MGAKIAVREASELQASVHLHEQRAMRPRCSGRCNVARVRMLSAARACRAMQWAAGAHACTSSVQCGHGAREDATWQTERSHLHGRECERERTVKGVTPQASPPMLHKALAVHGRVIARVQPHPGWRYPPGDTLSGLWPRTGLLASGQGCAPGWI